jgi:outer membrane protein assembly factor BamB
MRRHFVAIAVSAVAALVASVTAQTDATEERFWPQWRGPHATGESRTANPPTEWSETRNVRWKVEIPGRGTGSPVVWGDRLFLLSAVPIGVEGAASHEPRGQIQPRAVHRFIVLAIDRRTGRVV